MNQCYLGDCRAVMQDLIRGGVKVQTIVTSPPYYGLRNYGVDGQLGLEETPQQYIANMVEVFTCAWDLLADDGTLWLNIGDSYAGSGGNGQQEQSLGQSKFKKLQNITQKVEGFKRKELMMIPARLAIALSDAGWYLRQDIIWAKPNPMPESVTDRCTKAHEYVFLLTKSPKYYFDNEAIKESSTTYENRPSGVVREREYGYDSKQEKVRISLGKKSFSKGQANGIGINPSGNATKDFYEVPFNRNKRSVWTINTKPCTEAHLAVMPEELVENCILAGSKVGDIVFDPFMGSGTVGKVAQNLGRKWLGAELNPDYIKIQHKRTAQQGLELV